MNRLIGLCIAILVDVTEPLCIPLLLVGAALYCAVAIPLILVFGGWVLARDRFTKANATKQARAGSASPGSAGVRPAWARCKLGESPL